MIKLTNVENFAVIKMLKTFSTYLKLNYKHFLNYLTYCFHLLFNFYKQNIQHINITYLKGVYYD